VHLLFALLEVGKEAMWSRNRRTGSYISSFTKNIRILGVKNEKP
jgi:hypothetical protein